MRYGHTIVYKHLDIKKINYIHEYDIINIEEYLLEAFNYLELNIDIERYKNTSYDWIQFNYPYFEDIETIEYKLNLCLDYIYYIKTKEDCLKVIKYLKDVYNISINIPNKLVKKLHICEIHSEKYYNILNSFYSIDWPEEEFSNDKLNKLKDNETNLLDWSTDTLVRFIFSDKLYIQYYIIYE